MANSLFITCNKNVKIREEVPGKTRVSGEPEMREFDIPKDFVGSVPAWVAKHWYFKALCKDRTITTVVNTASTTLDAAAEAAKAKNAEVEREVEKMRRIDEAKNAARAEAEKAAEEEGLDQASKEDLINEAVTDAIKKVEEEFAAE